MAGQRKWLDKENQLKAEFGWINGKIKRNWQLN
jgi:hypothetical protein